MISYKDAFGEYIKEKDRVIYVTKSTGKYASSSIFSKGVIKSINEENVTIICKCLASCIDCYVLQSKDEVLTNGCAYCKEVVTVPFHYIIKIN